MIKSFYKKFIKDKLNKYFKEQLQMGEYSLNEIKISCTSKYLYIFYEHKTIFKIQKNWGNCHIEYITRKYEQCAKRKILKIVIYITKVTIELQNKYKN